MKKHFIIPAAIVLMSIGMALSSDRAFAQAGGDAGNNAIGQPGTDEYVPWRGKQNYYAPRDGVASSRRHAGKPAPMGSTTVGRYALGSSTTSVASSRSVSRQ